MENIEKNKSNKKNKAGKMKNYLAMFLAGLMILGFVVPVALQAIMYFK